MRRILKYAAVAVLLFVPLSAVAGIYSGRIVSVTPDKKQVVIQILSTNRASTYAVGAATKVTLDRRKVSLKQLEPGLRVTIATTKSGKLRTIAARTSRSTPRKAPAGIPRKATAASESRPSSVTSPESGARTLEAAPTGVSDWPSFRGPKGDNISSESGLLRQWPAGGPPLVWTGQGIGEGYSAVSVANGRVFTMGNVDGQECIVALDVQTGQKIWDAPNGSPYRHGEGNGPRGTPALDGDAVYGLGANGDLSCVDANTGRVRWQKNILREFGGSNITWGISESVLIDGETLICTPGGRTATVVALNIRDGRPRWRAIVPGNPQAAYASPIAIDVGRVRQYVVSTSKGVVGIRATNGEVLWGDDRAANDTANCATPLFVDNHIFSSSDYGTGASLIRLRARGSRVTSTPVYFKRTMKNHHGGMVAFNGHIYGSNSDILSCVRLRDGEPTWRQRGMKGSVILADGHIYFRDERGPVHLIEVTPHEFREKGRFDQPDRSDRPAWAHPVIAGGRLLLRDQDLLLCYGIRGPG